MAIITDETWTSISLLDEHSYVEWIGSDGNLLIDDNGEYIVFSLDDKATVIDDSDTGGWIFDGILGTWFDSNINALDVNSVPLNDIIPYDIIDYGDGITDDSGSATNITDD